MLNGLTLGILGFLGFFQQGDGTDLAIASYASLQWQEAGLFEIRYQQDTNTQTIVDRYLAQLDSGGKDPALQGIWLESAWSTLGNHQGNQPLSAASLTKIATTLAALEQWPLTHRFTTRVYTTGTVANGLVQGDLIIEAGGDPLLVWEEAIALGNALNQAGIRQIEGDLIIVGDFMMNYVAEPATSGDSFRLALDQRAWNDAIETQYQQMSPRPSRPQVAIAGKILTRQALPDGATLVLSHQSLTLADILKQMNLYSNNAVAEAIAQNLGGGPAMGTDIAQSLNIPSSEIQLINGSGLGVDNKISPRAAVAMLQAIDSKLQGQPFTVFDLLPIAGQDHGGTVNNRTIPPGIAFKTGTLNQVSALAGIMPTQTQGNVWFAIINNGTWDVSGYRQQQDQFLQTLSEQWPVIPPIDSTQKSPPDYFGNPERIQAN
ncbi:D-alanyl-D-alanine carboxypeptidase/D-alanyl-D-alanine-endopeptidase [Picosynechococcus sp. PCC 7117]|uniref:D-alanyl-D-alanine carboxypeptidase/D-alanyl-D-alanine-endopeptidase n=1 Tax=Picosynechococcus sp. PCC 7117 TaxID=195498 RepID=UPI000810B9E7|nr:D-alanyl-D-alanine carboxypeptidase [Picosynechococcus sp. PCC 7117]ANV86469.1 D-alanyl-D-alanine carboxypeptidase [Picosynechococcus sp. PCC 7117]